MEEMITIPRSEYEQMKSEINDLKAKVAWLLEEIVLLKNGHNSKTSSTAPSQDVGRSNSISLRGKSERKPGGQPGHTGHTLAMKEVADEVREHAPCRCSGCGEDLENVPVAMLSRRQEMELPPIQPHYNEHRSMVKTCPCCGLANHGDYPSGITAPIQYGSSVKSLVSYLFAYQFIPLPSLTPAVFRPVFATRIGGKCR